MAAEEAELVDECRHSAASPSMTTSTATWSLRSSPLGGKRGGEEGVMSSEEISGASPSPEKARFDFESLLVSARKAEKASFPCGVCGKRFRSVCAAHGHMRVHKGPREEAAAGVKEPPHAVVGGWGATGRRGRSGKGSGGPGFQAEEPHQAATTTATAVTVVTAHASERRESDGLRAFACATCGKRFRTHQGLGGHVAGHNNKARDAVVVTESHGNGNGDGRERKEHRCKVCGKEYATGLALGGHMRKHRKEPKRGGKEEKPASALPAVDGSAFVLRLFGAAICLGGGREAAAADADAASNAARRQEDQAVSSETMVVHEKF